MARLADTAFGRILRDHAQAEGIDLQAAPRAAQQATLAVVSLDAAARASYDFYLEGTADWQWTAQETARVPGRDRGAALRVARVLDAAGRRPGPRPGPAASVTAATCWSATTRTSGPGCWPTAATGSAWWSSAVGLAHLVKASTDDVAWLYPDRSPGQVARDWLRLGAAAVVITSSSDGAEAFTAQGWSVRRPALDVAVADTVGAGDSFTAGLIGSLIERGRHTPAGLARCLEDELSGALDDAILVASVNCERQGNDPPTAADVGAARGRLRPLA